MFSGQLVPGKERLLATTPCSRPRPKLTRTIVSLAQPSRDAGSFQSSVSSNGYSAPPHQDGPATSTSTRPSLDSPPAATAASVLEPRDTDAVTTSNGADWRPTGPTNGTRESPPAAASSTDDLLLLWSEDDTRASAALTAAPAASSARAAAVPPAPGVAITPQGVVELSEEAAAAVPPSATSVPLDPNTPLAQKLLSAAARRRLGAPPQPLVPPFDPLEVQKAVLGEPEMSPQLKELFRMTEPGTAPRLYKPQVPAPPSPQVPASQLPLLYYLPGIDGTGLAAYRQFPALSQAFDLQALLIPPQDRTPFEDMVSWLVGQIEATAKVTPNNRPIYLLGESSGALLALAVAHRCSAVDRVVICNPATSFADSLWPVAGAALSRLPLPLYRLLPVALSPLLTNPLAIAARNVERGDTLPRQLSDLAYGLLDLLPEVSTLRLALPPDTLAWRLQQLASSAAYVNSVLPKVPQRVLLLAGQRDRVLPNEDEVPRLKKLLPRCATRVLNGRSHAMLLEAGVDLVKIMKEEGFYVRTRRLTSDSTGRTKASGARQAANFGAAAALELPTLREVDLAAEGGGLKLLRRLVSPVFFSTRPSDGAVVSGLAGVPDLQSGPLLFVGPHSLFAPDMPIMIEEFLRQRGMLLRGLAHPIALEGIPKEDGTMSSDGNPFGNFLKTFGAVPTNGKNMHRLFSQGEAVLLYPGGVREALKNRDEKYTLLWPTRAEFVRMAARFGATIVPFAHVGAEDGINLVLDGRELLSLPVIGDRLRREAARLPKGRQGVNAEEELDSFIQPIIAPTTPARFYYLFGKPIRTTPELAKDKAASDALYAHVKKDVEDGITYLLRKRREDPYSDLGKRLFYEFAWGGKSAPTFLP